MARAPKITWDRLNDMISSGMGSGFGEAFKPWIQIRRWNPSPVSTQVIKPLPPFRRACHFLSKNEYSLGLIFSWLGCEFREQFPLWPWQHPHPETGRNFENDRYLAESIGLLQICSEAQITHGNFVGTSIPYIWTMDFCLHMPWVDDFKRATTMVSVKPIKAVVSKSNDALDRTLEKLEIERRYCKSIDINYLPLDQAFFKKALIGNLDLLQSAAIIPKNTPTFTKLHSFIDKYEHKIQYSPLSFIDEILIKEYKCEKNTSILIRNHLIWNQIIDVDLLKPLNLSRIPQSGGRKYKTKLRAFLEGNA